MAKAKTVITISRDQYFKMLTAGARDLKVSIRAQGSLLTGGKNQQHHLECVARDVFQKMVDSISVEIGVRDN